MRYVIIMMHRKQETHIVFIVTMFFFSMAKLSFIFILGSPGSITDADVLVLLNYTDLVINSREELYTLNYRKQSSGSDCLAVGDFLPLIALCAPSLRKYLWIFLGPHPTDLSLSEGFSRCDLLPIHKSGSLSICNFN